MVQTNRSGRPFRSWSGTWRRRLTSRPSCCSRSTARGLPLPDGPTAIYANMRFNPATDFKPITDVTGVQFGLAVSAASSVKTLAQFVQAGGRIWACGACTKPRGITPDVLVDGATIVTAAQVVELLASGAASLTF